MANNFKIKKGLIINNTQPITGITNNIIDNNDYSIPTVNAIKTYIDNRNTSINNQIVFNSGGTLSGTSNLTFDGNNLNVSKNVKTSFCLYSIDGATCIKMINKTGSSTVKGKLVTYYPPIDNSFIYYPSGNTIVDSYIGLTFEDGIADGEYTYIAIYGICDVKISSYSESIKLNEKLSTYNSTSDGDVLKDVGGWLVAYALEDGDPNDIIKCLLYSNDVQYIDSGYYA